MSLFTKKRIGKIVKVTKGLLSGKFAMIAKEYDKGYGVITDQTDWPSDVPPTYNALYVSKDDYVDVTEEEETLLRLKFPNSEQFE